MKTKNKFSMKFLLFLLLVTVFSGAGNIIASTLSLKNIKLPALQGVYTNYDIKTSTAALVLVTRSSEVPFSVRMTNNVEQSLSTPWYNLSTVTSTLQFSQTKDWFFKTNVQLKNQSWNIFSKNYDGEVKNY